MSARRLPISFYAQVLLCAGLWGSAFPVIKLSYSNLAIDTLGEQLLFAGTRFMLAGALVLPFCRSSVLSALRQAPMTQVLTIALGQTYFQYLFFYYALSISSGVLGGLLMGTGSLFWVLLAPLFLKTPLPSARQWAVLLCCMIGVGIAVYAPGAGSGDVLLGSIAFILAVVSGSVGALVMKQIGPYYGSRALTSIALFSGGCLLLLTGCYQWNAFWSDFNWVTLGVTCYLACLSATAFTVWNRLIERYSVNTLSAYRFLIPLCGVIESALFIPEETLGFGIIVGGAIVLASLFALSRMNIQSERA